jgi:hypothetical protein
MAVSSRIRRAVGFPTPKMYVSAVSTRFSRGRSTPAIRAILSLPLLVLGIALADDPDHPAPADHLAVLADGSDARTYLHDGLRKNA